MTEIHIFLFSFFPLNRSDKEWQLCTTEGPTPVFKCLGGREGPLMAEIYSFCFSIFFPNMSGISGIGSNSSSERPSNEGPTDNLDDLEMM